MNTLSDIDLNLLVYLDALLAECHVTNASKRVGLSQSAMSRALSRLRDLFEDELLVKTAQGMAPTPLAQRLEPEVRRILRSVERTVTRTDTFDPAVDLRQFKICADDYAMSVLIPGLTAQIGEHAPGDTLRVTPLHGEWPRRALAQAEIDLYLGALPEAARAMRTEELVRDEVICITRAGIDPPEDIGRFVDLDHIEVIDSAEAAGSIDAALMGLGRKRVIRHSVPQLSAALAIARRTDAIVCAPRRMVDALLHPEDDRLQMTPSPVELPRRQVGITHHLRATDDAAISWLRTQLQEVAQDRKSVV